MLLVGILTLVMMISCGVQVQDTTSSLGVTGKGSYSGDNFSFEGNGTGLGNLENPESLLWSWTFEIQNAGNTIVCETVQGLASTSVQIANPSVCINYTFSGTNQNPVITPGPGVNGAIDIEYTVTLVDPEDSSNTSSVSGNVSGGSASLISDCNNLDFKTAQGVVIPQDSFNKIYPYWLELGTGTDGTNFHPSSHNLNYNIYGPLGESQLLENLTSYISSNISENDQEYYNIEYQVMTNEGLQNSAYYITGGNLANLSVAMFVPYTMPGALPLLNSQTGGLEYVAGGISNLNLVEIRVYLNNKLYYLKNNSNYFYYDNDGNIAFTSPSSFDSSYEDSDGIGFDLGIYPKFTGTHKFRLEVELEENFPGSIFNDPGDKLLSNRSIISGKQNIIYNEFQFKVSCLDP